MAIAYESIATTDFNEVSPETLTIAKPSGLAVGDMMIANLVWDSNSTTAPTLPNGWTSLFHATTALESAGAYKVADANDVAATNFVFTLAGTVTGSGGSIMRWSGVGQVNAGSVFRDLSSTANPTFTTGVTPAVANSYLVFLYYTEFSLSNVSNYAITTDNPASWVEIAQESNTTPDVTMAIAYASRPETTATGNFSCTTDNSLNSHFGRLLYLYPRTDVNLSMPVGTLTLTSPTPSLTIDVNLEMSVGSLTVTGQTPTVSTTEKTAWTNETKNSTSWTNESKS